jgi:uncharacterized MAPEG superfamily protein
MNTTAMALILYMGWFLLLILAIIGVRLRASIVQGKPPNSFRTDGTDVSPFSGRLCGAHANGFESFPFVAGPLLLALATGTTELTDTLAMILPAARIGQSTVHLSSETARAVLARFGFFLIQVAVSGYLLVRLAEYFLTRS